jgi:ssDNA-binding Zn-finger/Zn-ribbon topoisomerase 1
MISDKLSKYEDEKFSEVLTKIKLSKNHNCPDCGEKTLDFDGDTYNINFVSYPIFGNVQMINEKDKHGWIWDEVHRCYKCDTVFYYHGDSVITHS